MTWPLAFAMVGSFVALFGFYFWSEVHRYRALRRVAELAAEAEPRALKGGEE